MLKEITSLNNKCFKMARRLITDKKYRRESGLFVIEGIRLVREALDSGHAIDFVLFDKHLQESPEMKSMKDILKSRNIACFLLERRTFLSIAQTKTPQGIMAVVKQPTDGDACGIFKNPDAFILVVDSVQDPGNLGTIIRSAHGASVDGIFITRGTVDVYNDKVIRSSMGSIFWVPLFMEWTPFDLLKELRQRNFKILVADVAATSLYYNENFAGSLAIVVGNENKGPSEVFLTNGNPIRIPCEAESLNVAVATSILLYERVRRGL